MTLLATIPSPTQNQIVIFGLPLRAYALCILVGIVAAIWLSSRRWMARGGKSGEILDLALWAVPFGIIGGRIYHVITTPEPYWGANGDPIKALYIWEGGLGIWGAIAFGALGAWIGARRIGMRMTSVADTLAPGLILAQAIGRLGNWFNNELYGGPSDGWLALQIHPLDSSGHALTDDSGAAIVLGTYQPTFLYEMIWNLLVFGALLWLDKKFRMGRGRVFAAYVGLYCLGRFFIEQMRSDTAELIFGQRLNVWTSLIVGLGAAAYLILIKGTREATPYVDDRPAYVDDEGNPTRYAPQGTEASDGAEADVEGDDDSDVDDDPDAGQSPVTAAADDEAVEEEPGAQDGTATREP